MNLRLPTLAASAVQTVSVEQTVLAASATLPRPLCLRQRLRVMRSFRWHKRVLRRQAHCCFRHGTSSTSQVRHVSSAHSVAAFFSADSCCEPLRLSCARLSTSQATLPTCPSIAVTLVAVAQRGRYLDRRCSRIWLAPLVCKSISKGSHMLSASFRWMLVALLVTMVFTGCQRYRPPGADYDTPIPGGHCPSCR